MVDQSVKPEIRDLGQIDYAQAWDLQKDLVSRAQSENAMDVLLLCEHNPVYTLGKSGDSNNLLISEKYLEQIGAQTFKIERGGDITFHGPGQLVGYPILNLHRLGMGVKAYVHLLEESIIQTLDHFGISARRVDGLIGIWLTEGAPRKIAAIGIKISRGISMHGFALNVNTDLKYFNHIVPCGIQDKAVTSMGLELGKQIGMDEVRSVYERVFMELFYTKNR